MKILFDQGTPLPLRKFLTGHEIVTAFHAGWSELSNGELITAAEVAGFEVLVTTDQNLKYQQNLTDRRLAIVVLLSTRWPDIEPHGQRIATAIGSTSSGTYLEISI